MKTIAVAKDQAAARLASLKKASDAEKVLHFLKSWDPADPEHLVDIRPSLTVSTGDSDSETIGEYLSRAAREYLDALTSRAIELARADIEAVTPLLRDEP